MSETTGDFSLTLQRAPARLQMSLMWAGQQSGARIGNYSERRACNLISGGRGRCTVNPIGPVSWPRLARPPQGCPGKMFAPFRRVCAKSCSTHHRHARPCAGHPRLFSSVDKAWMAGTSPAMTMKESLPQHIYNLVSFPGQPCALREGTREISATGGRPAKMAG